MKYKLLGRSGLKVSELCLGTMSFGAQAGWGADKETSFKIMEAFANAGGNFLNTANIYHLGNNEKIIGEFLSSRNRDYFVLATKYSLQGNNKISTASVNNHRNLICSVEESLKRLQTDFIDVLYLHIGDRYTPIDELLYAMNDLIKQGKVLYTAMSDAPAWIISRGNTMAELMGWNQFVAIQIEYNLLQRSAERDLIPMAKHFNISITPWAELDTFDARHLHNDSARIKHNNRLNAGSRRLTQAIITVAEKLEADPSHIALKWAMQQPFSVIPIVNATSEQQLLKNLKVVDVTISEEDMKHLDEISSVDSKNLEKPSKEEAVQMNAYEGMYGKIEMH